MQRLQKLRREVQSDHKTTESLGRAPKQKKTGSPHSLSTVHLVSKAQLVQDWFECPFDSNTRNKFSSPELHEVFTSQFPPGNQLKLLHPTYLNSSGSGIDKPLLFAGYADTRKSSKRRSLCNGALTFAPSACDARARTPHQNMCC